MPDRDLRVNLGRLELRVSEHLLDEPDVGAAFKHQRRAGVAEQMAGPGLADLALVDVVADKLGQAVRLEGLPSVGQENRAVVR